MYLAHKLDFWDSALSALYLTTDRGKQPANLLGVINCTQPYINPKGNGTLGDVWTMQIEMKDMVDSDMVNFILTNKTASFFLGLKNLL